MDYIIWELDTPGISFSIRSGRITIFQRTLEVLGNPEFYRFLFDPAGLRFAIEVCGIDDEGAKTMPQVRPRGSCDIKSLELVRFVYRTCGWKKNLTYRIAGTHHPSHNLVDFDLSQALEIHEGRTVMQGNDEAAVT